MSKKLTDYIDTTSKFMGLDFIRGNYNEAEDLVSANEKRRQMFAFLNKSDLSNSRSIDFAGIESDEFKKRIFKTEEEELINRLYLTNNYRGFGFKKSIESFEKTMQDILSSTIIVKSDDINKELKEKTLKEIEQKLFSLFKDNSLSNDEVKKEINKIFALESKNLEIDIADSIVKSSSILIDKYRTSVYNLKQINSDNEALNKLEQLRLDGLEKVTKHIKKINDLVSFENRLDLKEVMKEIKINGIINPTKTDKIYEDAKAKAIEIYEKEEANAIKENTAFNKDKTEYINSMLNSVYLDLEDMKNNAKILETHSMQISILNKQDRLASIALNYFYAEKNLIEMQNADEELQKVNQLKAKISDILPTFTMKNRDKDVYTSEVLIGKITKLSNNEKRLNNYAKRVADRINGDNKQNFGIKESEVIEAIRKCEQMFKDFSSKENNPNKEILIKLNDKMKDYTENINREDKNKMKYLDTNIIETISNTLKDNLYNQLLDDMAKDEKIANVFPIKDDIDNFKYNVKANLSNDIYAFDIKKNEEILSCHNMQEMFNLLANKKITSNEALEIVRNNGDFLKTFSSDEKEAVEELVENIAQIKKREAEQRRTKDSKHPENMFDDLKERDSAYTAEYEVANDLTRKHIDYLLGQQDNGFNKFGRKMLNLIGSKEALRELSNCAAKQVETRKMDTQLSMASQCLESYRQKAENMVKESERNIEKAFQNPTIITTGIGGFLLLLVLLQRMKLKDEQRLAIEKEKNIAQVIAHINSVRDTKVKDALSILYKLDNDTNSTKTPLSFTTEKELLIDIKEEFFYAELLKVGKEEINTSLFKSIALEDLSIIESNALDDMVLILGKSENRNLKKEIEDDLIKFDAITREDKRIRYITEQEEQNLTIQRQTEERIENITRNYEKATLTYTNAVAKINPELAEKIRNTKDILNPEYLKDISSESGQKELKSMLKELYDIQDTMITARTELIDVKKQLERLKKEREDISPFVDVLNENGVMCSKKLTEAVKNNPDKVINMFLNLDSIKREENDTIKKMIIYSVMNRASKTVEAGGVFSKDYYNEIMKKITPFNKNLVENLSSYRYSSIAHQDGDKVTLNIVSKEAKPSKIMSKLKDMATADVLSLLKDDKSKDKEKNKEENKEYGHNEKDKDKEYGYEQGISL